MEVFGGYARRFKENDIPTIPLIIGDKKPFFTGWTRYCETAPSAEELETWEVQYPDHNIGLPCGIAAGVVALDIDTDDLEITKKLYEIIPASPVRKRGKKGETRFYRYSGETNWKFRIRPHTPPIVELLSTGTQTVLPPSIHPDTREPYRWITPDTLESYSPKDLPALPKDLYERLSKAFLGVEPSKDLGEGGRTLRLKSQVVAALKKEKDRSTVVDEIFKYDFDNHTPPLFSDPTEFKYRKTPRENAESFVLSIEKSLLTKGILKGKDTSEPGSEESSSTCSFAIGDIGLIVYQGVLNENSTSLLGLEPIEVEALDRDFLRKTQVTLLLSKEQELNDVVKKLTEKVRRLSPEAKLYVVSLPEVFKDPDELIKAKGLEAFREVIRTAQADYIYLLNKRFDVTDQIKLKTGELDDKDRDLLLEDVVTIGSQAKGPIARDLFNQAFLERGEHLGVTKEGLDSAIERLQYSREKEEQAKEFRKLLDKAQDLANSGREQEAQELLSKQSKQLNTGLLETSYHALVKTITEAEVREALKNKTDHIDSGLKLGKETLYLPAGAITILAAPTSHGKTSFQINLALNMVNDVKNKPVYIFSYEENRESILLKAFNTYVNKNLSQNNRRSIESYFKTGSDEFISRDHRTDFARLKESFFSELVDTGRFNVHYVDYSAEELVGAIKYLHKHAQVGAIFIDYIQLLRLKDNRTTSRQEELKQVCLDLKDCAVDTGLPIILGAQFNREVNSRDKLHATKIGEAGDIERIANLIIGFWNCMYPDYEKDNGGVPELYTIILKGRDMGAGAFETFDFNGDTGKIKNKAPVERIS